MYFVIGSFRSKYSDKLPQHFIDWLQNLKRKYLAKYKTSFKNPERGPQI